jgi:uncharacterized protein (DUF58 family)
VNGDDFRRIDWNAYARLERFYIKLFVEEEDLSVHFLVDNSSSMCWGNPNKLNFAVHIAGAIGYIALAGLDRVTATAIGNYQNNGMAYFPPHRGKRQALALFSFLQSLTEQSPRQHSSLNHPFDPAEVLRAYASTRAPAGSKPGTLILLSDLLNDGWIEGVQALASRGFEVSVIHILAPDEINPDLAGDLKLIDAEDSSFVEITSDYDILSRYKKGLDDWMAGLQRFFSARGSLYIPLSTTMPLETLLFAWLERKGVLR